MVYDSIGEPTGRLNKNLNDSPAQIQTQKPNKQLEMPGRFVSVYSSELLQIKSVGLYTT
jgi:hypothetical protein